jgi:hypothetical protein
VRQSDPESFSVVPNTELVVAREAYANNTSKYFLNGKASAFTEVTEVFKAKGVDLDNNRFLILQARARALSLRNTFRANARARAPHAQPAHRAQYSPAARRTPRTPPGAHARPHPRRAGLALTHARSWRAHSPVFSCARVPMPHHCHRARLSRSL